MPVVQTALLQPSVISGWSKHLLYLTQYQSRGIRAGPASPPKKSLSSRDKSSPARAMVSSTLVHSTTLLGCRTHCTPGQKFPGLQSTFSHLSHLWAKKHQNKLPYSYLATHNMYPILFTVWHLNIHAGQFYVSTWIGHSTQIFGQILFKMFLWRYIHRYD